MTVPGIRCDRLIAVYPPERDKPRLENGLD